MEAIRTDESDTMAIEEDKAIKAASETVVEETELGYQVFNAPDESVLHQTDTDRIPRFDVTQEMLSESGDDPESWLMFANNYEQHRYTTADVVTKDNVGELQLEYEMTVGANSSMEGSPVVVPGNPPVMYQTNGPSHVKAIDAARARCSGVTPTRRRRTRCSVVTTTTARGCRLERQDLHDVAGLGRPGARSLHRRGTLVYEPRTFTV